MIELEVGKLEVESMVEELLEKEEAGIVGLE